MFTAALKEHKARQQQNKAHTAECRAAVLSNVEAFSAEVMDDLNGGLLEVLANQKKIEQETQRLQLQTAQLTKQVDRWVASFAVLNNGLKEFGDLANWAAVLEADMTRIAESLSSTVAIKQQQQQQQQQQQSGGEERRRAAAGAQPQPTQPTTAVAAAASTADTSASAVS